MAALPPQPAKALPGAASRLGLSASGPTVIKNGLPYLGAGVAFYDAFIQTPTALAACFAELQSYGVPFIRFNAGWYGAGATSTSEWQIYLNAPSIYWAQMDIIVGLANEYGIGLIPSLMWRYETFCDLMAYTSAGLRDTISQWGVSGSNVRNFAAGFVAAFVQRYANNPAIWMWEIGNEFEAEILYTGTTTITRIPPTTVTEGSPSQYYATPPGGTANGVTDIVYYNDVFAMRAALCAVIRANDPHGRMISGGQSVTPSNSYNLYASANNGGPDYYANWMGSAPGGGDWQTYINDSSLDCFCAHVYPDALVPHWYWQDDPPTILPTGMVGLCRSLAATPSAAYPNGRPFFMGEWGTVVGYTESAINLVPTQAVETAQFDAFVNSIIVNQVPLSTLWNYDFSTNNSNLYRWNINNSGPYPQPQRLYQLQAIAGLNAALQALTP